MRVVHAIEERHLDDLLALYHGVWWAGSRTRADVERMLAGTDAVVGLVDDDERLVAFCRALSDGVYRAVVYDVIARDDLRGRGLGRRLMEAVLAHPAVAPCESVALWCKPEMVALYRRFGFAEGVADLRLMLRS